MTVTPSQNKHVKSACGIWGLSMDHDGAIYRGQSSALVPEGLGTWSYTFLQVYVGNYKIPGSPSVVLAFVFSISSSFFCLLLSGIGPGLGCIDTSARPASSASPSSAVLEPSSPQTLETATGLKSLNLSRSCRIGICQLTSTVTLKLFFFLSTSLRSSPDLYTSVIRRTLGYTREHSSTSNCRDQLNSPRSEGTYEGDILTS